MVGMYCSVALCSNSYQKTKSKGISFHSFPKNPSVREQWLAQCKRMDPINPNTGFICSEHFDPSDFERDLQAELLGTTSRKKLKKGVIPQLKIPNEPRPPKTPAAIRRMKQAEQKHSKMSSEESDLHTQPQTPVAVFENIDTVIELPPNYYQILFEETMEMYRQSQQKVESLQKKLKKCLEEKNKFKERAKKYRREKILAVQDFKSALDIEKVKWQRKAHKRFIKRLNKNIKIKKEKDNNLEIL